MLNCIEFNKECHNFIHRLSGIRRKIVREAEKKKNDSMEI
jgi:hypothetical protein